MVTATTDNLMAHAGSALALALVSPSVTPSFVPGPTAGTRACRTRITA